MKCSSSVVFSWNHPYFALRNSDPAQTSAVDFLSNQQQNGNRSLNVEKQHTFHHMPFQRVRVFGSTWVYKATPEK